MKASSSRLRIRKSELFELIHYVPHPGQLRVHKSRAKRRVMCCGTRFGKSSCAAVETLVHLLSPARTSRGWLVAPTFDLTDRIFARVAELVERHFKHRIIELNMRTRVIRMRNLGGGVSELKAKSADKPVGLLGEALDWLVVDEAAKLSDTIWDLHLAARLVDRDGHALLLSTPRGCNWFWREWRRGQGGRDPTYESWQSPTSENPHIARTLIEEEGRRLAPDVYKQEYVAEFVGAGADTCFICNWPDPMARCVYVIGVDGDEAPARCPDCDGHVDKDGHTLDGRSTTGARMFTLITLNPRVSAPPAIPVDHMPLPRLEADVAAASANEAPNSP